MKKLIITLALLVPLAACTNTEKGAVIGGASGAALGTLAGGNDTRNAIIGGAAGAILGAVIGQSMDANGNRRYDSRNRPLCEYRRANGTRYVDRCPAGY